MEPINVNVRCAVCAQAFTTTQASIDGGTAECPGCEVVVAVNPLDLPPLDGDEPMMPW